MSITFESQRLINADALEQAFTLGDVPGVIWMPATASASTRRPLVLLGHPGGLRQMHSRLQARALSCVSQGFAAVAIELPGSGDRPRINALEEARADMRRCLGEGVPISPEIVDRLILPLTETAVEEWQALLDATHALPGLDGPVAYSGGLISVGVRLALAERRIVAAALVAGGFVPASILEDAKAVSIPLHVLLQWDNAGNDRQQALDLFDAFGSTEKTLQANMGGDRGVPAYAEEDVARFYARHLL